MIEKNNDTEVLDELSEKLLKVSEATVERGTYMTPAAQQMLFAKIKEILAKRNKQ